MEFFPDGAFVWLRSHGTSKYVYADRDWIGVSLRPLGDDQPLEAVWRVQHQHMAVNQEDVVFVLLQNAAYGRYLSSSPYKAPPGQRGRRAVQADRNEQPNNVNAFRLWWRVERVDPNQDLVRLRYANSNFDLRANGRYYIRNTGVTVYRRRDRTTMMQWTVHVPLPLPVAPPQPQQTQGGCRGLLFWRRNRNSGPGRTIRHVLANDDGNFDQNPQNWPAFTSYDHSVFNLRTHLEQLHGDSNGDMIGFTLCVRPGLLGRLMPLVVDLPRSLDPMHIVVLRTGSPAAAELVYPKIMHQHSRVRERNF